MQPATQTPHELPRPAPAPLEADDARPLSSNIPTSSRLSAALSLQQQLQQRLEQSAIELAARRRADELSRERKEGRETSKARRERLVKEVERLRVEVSDAKGKRAIREGVVDAMDRSHLVTQHLYAHSSAAEPTRQQAALHSLLTTRDSLALQLLQAQNTLSSLTSERTKLRKKLLVQNRQNAALVAELRTLQQPPEELIDRLPSEVQAYYERLQSESLLISSRLSIIRNVFQRLVAESGVEIFPPSSGLFRSSSTTVDGEELKKLLDPSEAAEEDDGEPMTDAKLLRLLLLAGDGETGSSVFELGMATGADEVGTEEGQRLPSELRPIMQEWKAAESLRRGVEKAKVKRLRTV
ncbi:hypothetical protein JCM11251_000864 [Rhodosporidiobolus azoricus]